MTVAHLSRSQFDAVLFDLDGVLTATASVHVAAWRLVFDEPCAPVERERAP